MPSLMNVNSVFVKFGIALVSVSALCYFIRDRFLLPPLVMDGSSSHDFKPVAREFKRLVESRAELGGAFAVYYKGQAVLEMTAGYRDLEYAVPWSDNTLAYAMSVAKAAASLCVASLVSQGHASYEDPVAKHWPEFAAAGKQDVTIQQLLNHQAGLIGLDRRLKLKELSENQPIVGETLAKQAPSLPVGNLAYHGLTFGLYVDQLVRRIDPKHRPIEQYFHEEIVKPAKVEAYLGLSRYQFYRLARIHFSIAWNLVYQLGTLDFAALKVYLLPAVSSISRKVSFSVFEDAGIYLMRLNDPDVAALPLASVNLVTNAPSLARLFSLLASNGSLDGNRIVGAETLAQLLDWDRAASSTAEPVSGLSMTFNSGFLLRKSPVDTTMIGHLGFGGQMVWADPDNQVTVAYLTNHMRPCSPNRDVIHNQLIDAVYQVIAKLKAKQK